MVNKDEAEALRSDAHKLRHQPGQDRGAKANALLAESICLLVEELECLREDLRRSK